MFVIAPAAAYVGKWLQSFREFPPRQKPGSFNLERVMEQVTSTGAPPRNCEVAGQGSLSGHSMGTGGTVDALSPEFCHYRFIISRGSAPCEPTRVSSQPAFLKLLSNINESTEFHISVDTRSAARSAILL